MYILFFSDFFPPERNAAASRVYERALYWVRWGHQVTVITSFPNFPEGKIYTGYRNKWYAVENYEGIRIVRVKTFIARNEGVLLRMLDFFSYMVTGFVAGLFERKPDIIAATSPQFFTAVAGWLVSCLKRTPFVFELGDLWPASVKAVGAIKQSTLIRIMEKVEIFLYHRSASIIALTQSFKDDLVSRGIPREKVSVVTNGVDISRFQPRPHCHKLAEKLGLKKRFTIGYIGTHGMAHALDNVLKAAEILQNKDSPISFLFVGAGADRESLIAEKERLNLKNVTFVPAQPKELIQDYWSICDVALVHLKNAPVFETVIPSKIFEAMGMGLPMILAAPKGEATRILEEAGAGLIVPAENPKALADAALTIEADHEMRNQLRERSLVAAPRFTREKQARDYVQVLEQVITRNEQGLIYERTN